MSITVHAARTLLTLEEKDPKRIFEGQALMRRMYKYGLLNETQVSARKQPVQRDVFCSWVICQTAIDALGGK